MSTPVRDQSRSEGEEDRATDPKDLEVRKLSPSGLVISGAAAATASVVGGQLGVAGTVVGAGLTSVVSALALALYSDSVHRGSAKLKEAKVKVTRRDQRGATGEPFASRTSATAHGAAAAGNDHDEPATTGVAPGRRRIVKTMLLALGIALIGLLAVFGIQRVTGTELSPGTGQIQRTVGDSDAVAPRDDSGTQQDAPEDTEQQEEPGEGGVPSPQESESPQPQDEAPRDEDEGEVEAPDAPTEQTPGTGDGDGSGSGSGGGISGEGDSARSSGSGASEGSGAGGE